MAQCPVIINGAPLPAELNTALTQLATAHPELLEFDSARGIVKFKSDLTFAKGSAELTPQAKAAAGQLANVLNSSAARNYEFLVAGHTDTVPIVKTVAFKDNWDLSAARALTVTKFLIEKGLRPRALAAAGYGEFDPVGNNRTEPGRQQNRRIEIVLLPNIAELPKMPSVGDKP
jgi:chemotaxis protein MotB